MGILPFILENQWPSQMPKCEVHLAFGPKLLHQLDVGPAQQNLGPKAKNLYGAFLYVNIN